MNGSIVLTGATSGFGAAALADIAERSEKPIIVGARAPTKLSDKYGARVKALPLDLESLDSVRRFCADLAGIRISALGLNAGITSRKISLTEDGFERTFQVNYLAHFLLFQLLKDQLTNEAIIVTTGSGTHDPAENAPPPAPRHANAEWLAHPDRDPKRDRLGSRAAGRAYTASKLCCILLAMEIAKRFPSVKSASFDPGFLPETNLAREFPSILAAIIKGVIPYTMPRDRTGKVATTAPAYASLVLGAMSLSASGVYLAMRGGRALEVAPSELAGKPSIGETLWEDSLRLLA
ncbi:MAG: SDR family NAD(P)-dependent oxidoreductase [Pseudomonadota bacterium]